MWKNLVKIITFLPSWITWWVSIVVAFYLWYSYSDIEYVAGNYQSYTFAYIDTLLSYIMILCFPIVLAAIVYKSLHFWKRNVKKGTSFFAVFSWIISTFITGCVCCWVSLLSVLGLTSIISFLEILPYDGLEVKSFAILLLVYSTYDALKNLEVCKIKK